MTTLALTSDQAASTSDADALVVTVASDGDTLRVMGQASVLPAAARRRIESSLHAVRASAETGAITRIPAVTGVAAGSVIAVGVGSFSSAGIAPKVLRNSIADAVRSASGMGHLALVPTRRDKMDLAALAEGALLGAYSYVEYRTSPDSSRSLDRISILWGTEPDSSLDEVASATTIVARAVNWARDQVNSPPGNLRPSHLAVRAQQLVEGSGVEATVFDHDYLADNGFGGISAVGQGSDDPPRLVRLRYQHPGAQRHLALAGKGITFDSGGLSIKGAKPMEWMKADMGGAAAVIAATAAIAQLGIAINVTAWTPLAENMPGGGAQRPGDVITMYGGKTVEVLNTDAEGRLVLGDALVRAAEDEPDLIVDVATLTGAAMIALGPDIFGVMGNDTSLTDLVCSAAERGGENAWPMPLPPELRPSLDSPIADLANVGDKNGGMLTAALFLAEFVAEGMPWAHLDIAGPAFNHGQPRGTTPKGGTGSAVRTLIELARKLSDGPDDQSR